MSRQIDMVTLVSAAVLLAVTKRYLLFRPSWYHIPYFMSDV